MSYAAVAEVGSPNITICLSLYKRMIGATVKKQRSIGREEAANTRNTPSTLRRILSAVAGLCLIMLLATEGATISAASSLASPSMTRGVDVDWIGGGALPAAMRSPAAELAQSLVVMQYVKSLGSNSVMISFSFGMRSPTSNVLYQEPITPSVAQLGLAVEAAHQYGLRVTLRAFLDQKVLREFGADYWSGNIEPSNRAKWFSSLSSVLTPYLRFAQNRGVSEFVIGSELDSLAGDPHWAGLLHQVSTIYKGRLSYSANWDVYQLDDVGVPVQAVGVDAYPPQNVGTNATVSQLTKGWLSWFDKAPASLRARTTIDEIGIVPTAGAYKVPYAWSLAGKYDPEIQTRWFTAACSAARTSGISGIYFWGMTSSQIPTETASDAGGDSFVNRPAVAAIKWCFRNVY